MYQNRLEAKSNNACAKMRKAKAWARSEKDLFSHRLRWMGNRSHPSAHAGGPMARKGLLMGTGLDEDMRLRLPTDAIALRQPRQESASVPREGRRDWSSLTEINRLIQRIATSFFRQGDDAQFVIGDGRLRGTKLRLRVKGKKLSLSVTGAFGDAKDLLKSHSHILKDRLARHEIIFQELSFY